MKTGRLGAIGQGARRRGAAHWGAVGGEGARGALRGSGLKERSSLPSAGCQIRVCQFESWLHPLGRITTLC